ncbi:MAG: hypothetical protein WAM14_17975 [Candidatus Nitrosopolaris sp.]
MNTPYTAKTTKRLHHQTIHLVWYTQRHMKKDRKTVKRQQEWCYFGITKKPTDNTSEKKDESEKQSSQGVDLLMSNKCFWCDDTCSIM